MASLNPFATVRHRLPGTWPARPPHLGRMSRVTCLPWPPVLAWTIAGQDSADCLLSCSPPLACLLRQRTQRHPGSGWHMHCAVALILDSPPHAAPLFLLSMRQAGEQPPAVLPSSDMLSLPAADLLLRAGARPAAGGVRHRGARRGQRPQHRRPAPGRRRGGPGGPSRPLPAPGTVSFPCPASFDHHRALQVPFCPCNRVS